MFFGGILELACLYKILVTVKALVGVLTLYSKDTLFDVSTIDSFWKTVWEKDIARIEQFLLFPQCCLSNQIVVSVVVR